MDSTTEKKINTVYLPEKWREVLADKHGVSVGTVEKVVYGQRRLTARNLEIFTSALELAEAGKASLDQIDKRLAALSA